MLMIPRCICTSGLSGWRQSLQKNYGTFEDWEWHADTYGLHTRLGFKSFHGKTAPTINHTT